MKEVIFYDGSPKIPKDGGYHRVETVNVYDNDDFDIGISKHIPNIPKDVKFILFDGIQNAILNGRIIDAIAIVRWCTDWNFTKARNFVWCFEREY